MRSGRGALACAGVLLALALSSGCGKGGSRTVAIVGDHRITSALVEQSIYEQNASSSAFAGRAPARLPPEPPDFTSCISYFKANEPSQKGARTSPATAQLKERCKYEYEKEKLKALYFLIPYEWVSGEAAELGVHASKREVAQRVALFERGFPSKAVMERYLRLIKEPRSRLEARMRVAVLTTRIEETLQSRLRALPPAQRQARLKQYGKVFEAKWRARTECKEGYVVPLCRQYKPPSTPSTLVPPSVPLTDLAG